ncbi:exoribonuclease R [human gut metagenome]|uniref:exoribonuclease II n=1 Tax=human gut metagenome TaxID=408170 RepID=K1U8L4_9ZZZZ
MKDKIVGILKDSDKALTIYDLEDKLHLLDVDELQELQTCLSELEKDAVIYHSNKDKYMMLEDSHLKRGIMRANKKGFGFVDIDDSDVDVYISEEHMNGALHDDIVLVEITSKRGIDRLEGRVVKIINREKDTYVGEINFEGDTGIVSLDDNKLKIKVQIPRDKSMNAVDGHKVVVRLGKRIDNSRFMGEVVEIIGHKNDPGIDILSIVKKYNIETDFPDDVKEQLKNIPSEVSEEECKNRRDLRNEMIFTIDGDDTKDIDDAVSIHRKPNGNYVLGVHIADVSYYVKEGSPLDNDAMERGTSVYLVDRVIPMLPHELSNGICSLNPNVSRLAISCVMEFDSHGKQIDYEIFESVIKSRIQMTYKKVNSILEKNIVPEGYEEYADSLRMMADLAEILRKAKENRGYIDFEVDEAKILVNEKCEPTEIVLRDRGVGENLIEDFMIAANECVATHIYFMNLPFIYRVHEVPKEEKIRSFLGFIGGLGYQINGNLKDNNPKSIQRLIKFLEDKKEFKILSKLLLRSMQKAVYKPVNLGHFGLASKCYTHFTSPIRRYPDTTVHRLLRTYLFQHKLDDNTISHWEDKLVYVADHSSAKERSSIDCEREVEDMKMAQYMEGHIGEEFEGMISSVMSFGIFVELDNLIEGLVSIKDMKGFFNYDEDRMTLTNEKSHVKYTIGERIKVRVIRASREAKTIDFEIVKKV